MNFKLILVPALVFSAFWLILIKYRLLFLLSFHFFNLTHNSLKTPYFQVKSGVPSRSYGVA